MNTSHPSFGTLALTTALALGSALLCAPNEASAVYRNTSGGGACKPAYGASTKFTFSNTFLENIGTTDQYVICHIVMDDPGSSPPPPTFFNVLFTAGATGGTAVCIVQNGYYGYGGNNLSANVAGSITLAAGAPGAVEWDETQLVRGQVYFTVTLNCKVPGSWRLGLIQYWTAG